MIANTSHTQEEVIDLMDKIYQHTNFPTFEQFKQNPDKWRKNEEDIFESLSQMNVFFKDRVASVTYSWRGKYRCKTLEQLQKMTREEGYRGSDLEYEPIVKPRDGTSNLYNSKMHLTINIFSKTEMRLMGKVVAND